MSRVKPLLYNLTGQNDFAIIDTIVTVWIDCQDAEGYETEDIIEDLKWVQETWANQSVKAVCQKHIDLQSR